MTNPSNTYGYRPSNIARNKEMYERLLNDDSILCVHCRKPFGEHCTADDTCPMPPYLKRGPDGVDQEFHGGFNRFKSFTEQGA